MRLEVEKRLPIYEPTVQHIEKNLLSLKSYRSPSFAALIDDNDDYIQVAGGGGVCGIERYNAKSGELFRAVSQETSSVFTENTTLLFGGNQIVLRPDEWFTIKHATAAFFTFNLGDKMAGLTWRDITDLIVPKSA